MRVQTNAQVPLSSLQLVIGSVKSWSISGTNQDRSKNNETPKVYDNLDFMRGVDVFLNTLSAASTLANIEGLKSVGCDNYTAVIQSIARCAHLLLLPRDRHHPGDV